MVKERRDMTVQSKESSKMMGYTNTHLLSTQPTAYDIFKEKKAESVKNTSSVNCAGTCAHLSTPTESTYSDFSYFAPKKSYEAEEGASASVAVEAVPSKMARQSKMTKNGKLLVALYVLIVGVIAFIILSANALNTPKSAIAENDIDATSACIEVIDSVGDIIA